MVLAYRILRRFLQTPLSIIQSRLEPLISQAERTEEQADIVDGWITITTQTDQLTITNSGNFLNVNHDRIFDRFFKQSNNSES